MQCDKQGDILKEGGQNLKYRFWLLLLFSMASREPMPRYFLSRTPSEKKYSPGASVVAANSEPIITVEADRGMCQGVRPLPLYCPEPSTCPTSPPGPLTCGGPQGQGLDHVSYRLDAPIGNDRHPKTPGILSYLVHSCALGATTGHH